MVVPKFVLAILQTISVILICLNSIHAIALSYLDKPIPLSLVLYLVFCAVIYSVITLLDILESNETKH